MRNATRPLPTWRSTSALHIPNFSLEGRSWSDPLVLQFGNSSDGALSEAGFTGFASSLVAGGTKKKTKKEKQKTQKTPTKTPYIIDVIFSFYFSGRGERKEFANKG